MSGYWNRNKPKALAKREITEEEEEVIKKIRAVYKNNRRSFFKDCLKIKHRDTLQSVPFVLNHAQESLLKLIENIEAFNEERKAAWVRTHAKPGETVVDETPALDINILVLKQRKGGISTFVQAVAYHLCEFFPDTHVMCMAHRGENAAYIASIAGSFDLKFPESDLEFRIPINRNSDQIVEWDPKWGSMIAVLSGGASEGVARGKSFDMLHISEVAHFAAPDAISAAKNASMPGALIIEETTAKGIDHSFYGSWQRAMYYEEIIGHWRQHNRTPADWNGKFKFFWGWHQDPGYTTPLTTEEATYLETSLSDYEREIRPQYSLTLGQLEWRRRTIATKCSEQTQMDPEDFFRQEYPLNELEAFVTSGNRVFSEARLIELERQARDIRPKSHGRMMFVDDGGVIYQPSNSSNYRFSQMVFWENPIPGRQYIIGIDTAEGLEHGDYTVCGVWDRTDGSRLVEAARFRGKLAPHLTGDLAVWLGRKYNNAYLIPEANNTGAATVQRIVRELRYEYIYHRLNEERVGGDAPDDSFTAGWKTYKHTKPLLIAQAQSILREGNIIIKHLDAIHEWRIYQNEDGKFNAPPGAHDDCTMADAFAIYAHRVAAPPVVLVKSKEETPWTPEKWQELYQEKISQLVKRKKERSRKRNLAIQKMQQAPRPPNPLA